MSPELRKAAILVSALDIEAAEATLAQLTPEQATAVRTAVLNLDDVPDDEQDAIIAEFFRLGPFDAKPNVHSQFSELPPRETDFDAHGLELSDHLAPSAKLQVDEVVFSTVTRAWNGPDARFASQRNTSSHRTQPFEQLRGESPDAILPLVEREHPQAIALVLAHLPPEKAGHVLARMPADVQADVVRRLVDLEETDPEVLREVESAIVRGLQTRGGKRKVAGEAAVSAILAAAEGAARRQILGNLATHHRTLAERFSPPRPRGEPLSFTELCDLDIPSILRVLRGANSELVCRALMGAPGDFVERILSHLRTDEARHIRRGMLPHGRASLREIEKAQAELAAVAGQVLEMEHSSHLAAVA